MNINVLVLDDKEPDFNKMFEIINSNDDFNSRNIIFQPVFNYANNKLLIQTFINYKHGGILSENIYGEEMKKYVEKIPNSKNLVCIIDVNWGYGKDDHLGIEFFKQFLLNKCELVNSLMISIIERDELKEDFKGLKFIPKTQRDKNGDVETMGKIFTQSLIDHINALPFLVNYSLKKNEDIQGASV
jgi:hypothetical protein